MKNLFFTLSLLLFLAGCASKNESKTIFIVRHAEKQLEGKDPELAYVGQIRSLKLGEILADQEIKHIFSTNYNRTKKTALPTAEAAGLEIESYDPKSQEELVEKLKKLEGNSLVVGHSNTVSQLANYFVEKGEKFKDLEEVDYEFIYVVTLDSKGSSVERKVYKDF
jgi:phosphohistidine phosphatase SixA